MKKNAFSSHEIYSIVKSKIVRGEFPPASSINAKRLSEHFGISRIPIRDVLIRLCGEGLVQKGLNNRFIVALLTEKDIRETYEMRGILEGYLVDLAARSFGDNDISLLKNNLELQKKETEKEKVNIEEFIQLNTQFHEYFFKSTTNTKFINTLKILRDYQNRYDRINWMSHGAFFVNIVFKQHKEIVEAVEKRNGEVAKKIIKLHMDTGVEFLIKALKEHNLLPETAN